ncbi:MAG: DUF4405 domain-containing protein [Planctomycetes bacterium]|nr:DUF4405 domain-containing protein [Planctomycetota bacterium]MBL7146910.1 DUF4405 domain-containing protein [Phycisphaerae bacterium]
MEKNNKLQFNWRAFFSVLSALSFIGMVFTGVILFVVPPGRIANWTGWTIIGLTKRQWIGLHDWLSIIFVVASVFHVYLNWKALVSYFKNKVSKAFALRIEWAFALVICCVVFLGTLVDIKPFSALLVWNENIKHSWDSPQQRAPIPHAELLTLTELSEQVGEVSLETILTNLKSRGIEVKSADVLLGDLADAHNMTPAHLYDIALGQAGPGRGQGGHGEGGRGFGGPGGRTDAQGDTGAEHEPGEAIRGIGRMTLSSYCNQMGLDVNEGVKKLQKAGFKASPDMTIRSIADSTGVHPSEIRTLLEAPIQ